jgi:hypothetical protein
MEHFLLSKTMRRHQRMHGNDPKYAPDLGVGRMASMPCIDEDHRMERTKTPSSNTGVASTARGNLCLHAPAGTGNLLEELCHGGPSFLRNRACATSGSPDTPCRTPGIPTARAYRAQTSARSPACRI